ncbi:MAG: hypothetical protein U0V75_10620 [Ferruginibacter sp.]
MKRICFLILAVSVFTSCKKEKAPSSLQQPAAEMKMVRADQQNSTGSTEMETYVYDAKGRLSEWRNNNFLYVFDYSIPGKITAAEKDLNSGNPEWNFDCDVNGKGFITSIKIKYPDGVLYGTYTFIYNADDYVTERAYKPASGNGFTMQYSIADGNVTGFKQVQAGTGIIYNGSYTYFGNLRNTFNYNYASYFPSDLFGKNCKKYGRCI